jgi:hypothetical protein
MPQARITSTGLSDQLCLAMAPICMLWNASKTRGEIIVRGVLGKRDHPTGEQQYHQWLPDEGRAHLPLDERCP